MDFSLLFQGPNFKLPKVTIMAFWAFLEFGAQKVLHKNNKNFGLTLFPNIDRPMLKTHQVFEKNYWRNFLN